MPRDSQVGECQDFLTLTILRFSCYLPSARKLRSSQRHACGELSVKNINSFNKGKLILDERDRDSSSRERWLKRFFAFHQAVKS